MKDVRPEFTPEEFEALKHDADLLNIPLKKLVHDRALQKEPDSDLFNTVLVLSKEISEYRAALNEIIKRETSADSHLYEDDIIRLEMSMANLEAVVSAVISDVMKKR